MWIEVDRASRAMVGGLSDAKPKMRDGIDAVECLIGFPDSVMWSADRDGFVDVALGYRWEAAKRTWVEDMAFVEALLLAEVKAEAERRKMLLLSAGGAKKTEYAEKRAEVLDWDTLGGTASAILLAFDKLPPASRAIRFAHAVADAAAFGDAPAAAIERFRAGLARSASTATICAVEARACAAIKAAVSAPAMRRAAAAIAWPA